MTDYIEFLNVGFGSDGKTLQVEFKVNSSCTLTKVYISNQNTWKSTDIHSDNYIDLTTTTGGNWTTTTDTDGNTIYKLNSTFIVTDGTTSFTGSYSINDLVVITTKFTISDPIASASDLDYREIAIYDLLQMRLGVLRLIRTLDCCDLPREIIDLMLKVDVIENAIKAKDYLLATKWWSKFYTEKVLFPKKKGCNCGF